MKLKPIAAAVLMTTALTLFAGTASAHVTVWPKETKTGAYEKYTVRVPVEKEINTTQVRVEFPTGMKVSTVMPLPGWNYEFEKDSEGVNKSITWTATNGGIKQHEFVEFSFVGANPKEVGAGTLVFKAYQTYSDKSVVEWTGDADSQTPASVSTLTQAAAGEDHHGGTGSADHADHSDGEAKESTSASNTLPIALAGGALLLSLISLFRKR
ncbi:YcnI family protein [Tumebacillus lipolyticus]|uniref:YcnI family protein n=1 Tax=Tumebacillus lipolyticus TaxID=1280370 RepID=A0ABW4ZSZ6_9BACL